MDRARCRYSLISVQGGNAGAVGFVWRILAIVHAFRDKMSETDLAMV
jgi:hypothetical protein